MQVLVQFVLDSLINSLTFPKRIFGANHAAVTRRSDNRKIVKVWSADAGRSFRCAQTTSKHPSEVPAAILPPPSCAHCCAFLLCAAESFLTKETARKRASAFLPLRKRRGFLRLLFSEVPESSPQSTGRR